MTRNTANTEPEMIVVGVDGSDGGRRALLFALREAQLRRCAVEAVRVARSEDDVALSDYALWADIVAIRPQLPGAPGVSLRVFVGDPAEILIERSETALSTARFTSSGGVALTPTPPNPSIILS